MDLDGFLFRFRMFRILSFTTLLWNQFLPDSPPLRISPFKTTRIQPVGNPWGRDPSGVLCGGTEPRADGSVLAWWVKVTVFVKESGGWGRFISRKQQTSIFYHTAFNLSCSHFCFWGEGILVENSMSLFISNFFILPLNLALRFFRHCSDVLIELKSWDFHVFWLKMIWLYTPKS